MLLGKLKARISTLKEYANLTKTQNSAKLEEWYLSQLDRLVVEYLVRHTFYDVASSYIQEANLKEFQDLDLYLGKVKPVIISMQEQNYVKAMQWIQANRPRIKKTQHATNCASKLEMELFIQNFAVLVNEGNETEAIQYSQKFLAPYMKKGTEYSEEVSRNMGTLFLSQKKEDIHKKYFGPERKKKLIELFLDVFNELYGIPLQPLLFIVIKAGLVSLKTPKCGKEPINQDCPACMPELSEVVKQIPIASKFTSSLVCPISKCVMDENNFPMVLPSGNVYSRSALEELEKMSPDGSIVDPKTHTSYFMKDAKRVYIT
ncbi:E3 ubiquitin-protein transferase MAEA-like [Schistocerca gregaria]|uniref:E3 ubiquitin-protein transferase MAEA-like n=1 Tax=Schistocerca gregaria TaxID=7010 RepID=UPI00211DFC2D|nr:E3 ubiquitin-protein transferase MAEA-like [Schistocerca gregaria]